MASNFVLWWILYNTTPSLSQCVLYIGPISQDRQVRCTHINSTSWWIVLIQLSSTVANVWTSCVWDKRVCLHTSETCTWCPWISKAFPFCTCTRWWVIKDYRTGCKEGCVCTRVCIAQWLDSDRSVIILSSSCLITLLSVLARTIFGIHCFPNVTNTTRWAGKTTCAQDTPMWVEPC